jgi:uncharacterized membrane protein HdeD (DUF308 family)
MEQKLRSYSDLLFGIAAIVVGLVMIVWSDRILLRLIQVIGAIAIVVGAIQFFSFLVRTKGVADRWTYMPLRWRGGFCCCSVQSCGKTCLLF